MNEKLQNTIKNCRQCIVAGFTKKEAKEYFAFVGKAEETVSFEEVYPFTGYNPCLLSIVKSMATIDDAWTAVGSEVKE